MPHYTHTQSGTPMLGAMWLLAAAVGLAARSSSMFGIVALVVTLAWTLYGRLTTIIDDRVILVRFGPVPAFRTSVRVGDVARAVSVRNSPLAGWGMRYFARGRLWNVWGLDAVELQFHDGRIFRIGTDEPATLLSALARAGIRT